MRHPRRTPNKNPFPSLPLSDRPTPLITHIDADAFFASVEQGFNPLLRGKPVIVGGKENQRGVVHTASYEARARGVHTGMPLARAREICPEAVFLKGNFQHYQAASLVLQEIYLQYTPQVEFTSLDDAYLDLTGSRHLFLGEGEGRFAGPEALARRIQQQVEEALHITVSIGMASNKVVARIASGLKKPRGVVYVPAGEERDFLAPLPVDELPGVGRVAKEILTDLGIFTIGQLAGLPKLVVEDLFGANGAKMWELANGRDPRPVRQRILPGQISRETTFEEDTTEREVVLATLQYLTERIGAKLRQGGWLARRVAVKIRYSDFTQHQMAHTLAEPTDNAAELFAEVQRLVTRIPFRRLRIRHVGVQVSQIEWRNLQLQLFSQEDRLESLDEAIDQIREKFGFTAILPADTLELRKKYRMEKSGYVLHSPALTR
ncbi:MAG: DNA polymerase IV [Calditrichaeota bacterium]|nr:MAG: DNA polymerase IV [Calditrichota bacterium]